MTLEDAEACRVVDGVATEHTATRFVDTISNEYSRFDDLVMQAWESGGFNKMLASVDFQVQQRDGLGEFQDTYPRLREAMAAAASQQCLTATTDRGRDVDVRAVVFGIAVSGSLANATALMSEDFIQTVRGSGWLPEADVALSAVGFVSASDALALARNPKVCWQLARQAIQGNGRHGAGVVVPGLVTPTAIQPSASGFDAHMGGHVLLMTALCVGGVDVPALDPPDNQDDIVRDWVQRVQGFLDTSVGDDANALGVVGWPVSLAQASRQALAEDIILSLSVRRALDGAEDEDEYPTLMRMAFKSSPGAGLVDVVGQFEDGSQGRMAGVLPATDLDLVEDLADYPCDRLVSRPDVLLDGESAQWEIAPEIHGQDGVAAPAAPRRLH